MNFELQIIDHSAKLKVDGRNIETNVTNLNMVIRTLEAHRDHMTAREFFDATLAQVDFENPSMERIAAFLRRLIEHPKYVSTEEAARRWELWPELKYLQQNGLAIETLDCSCPVFLPTAQGVRWIAKREGRDPDAAVHKYWEGRGARSGDWWIVDDRKKQAHGQS